MAAVLGIPSCGAGPLGAGRQLSATSAAGSAGHAIGIQAQTLPPLTETESPPAQVQAPEPTLTPQPTSQQVINPLTGLPVSDPALLARRVVAIKVSNYPRTARPQAGLSYADLLFEFYQESGETRFQALFLSQDVTKVGPIRSGRILDAMLEKMYQSILVFNGADSRVWDWLALQGVRSNSLYEGPAPCPALCRDSSQAHINSLYGNTAALRKAAEAIHIPEVVPDLGGMVFDPVAPGNGKPGQDLLVRFLTDQARAEWRYDPASDKYLRWSETDTGSMAPLTDRLSGQQLSVSNLIVVFVPFNKHPTNPKSVEMYDVNLLGSGGALFFRDGQEWQGIWRVEDPNRPLQFFGEDGPFALHPGVTWIALVGESSTFSSNGDAWRVEFALP
ncbi:MAG: DUF3048 domain-containing protein [Anaerolineales bacterium]|jgi:hypothetical protein